MKRIICHGLITGAMISISLCFIGGLTKLESRQAMALVNYGVKVSVLSPKKSTRPKSLITHVFSVVNQGQKEDTYELKVKVPEGWMVVTEPGSITLSPGEERPVFVSVSLPSSVPAGKYWIQFTATSQADPSVFASAKASVKVTEVYGVKVKVLTLERPARAGQATDYLFRITNLGNVSDRFQISVTSLHKWAIDLTKEKVKLRPGQEVELIASLTIPGEVELTRDYLTFKVFSKKASDTKRIIIKVFPIPRKALGTIYRQVPAVLTLRSIGSLPPGSLKTQVGFTTGGTLKDDRWFALKLSSSNQTTFSLVNLTSTLKDVIDWRFSFDQFQYGWSWGDITLGNISLNLPSLKDKIAGRGVKFRVQTGSSQFAVYTAWDRLQIGLDMALPPFKKDPLEASLRIDSLIKEGVTNIGGMLTAEIDDMKAEALNLNWTSISRVNYQKGKSDEEIGVDQKLVGMLKDPQANALTLSYKYQNGGITNKLGQGVLDLKADQNLGFLSLSEKIGISSKGSQLDKLAQLSSLLDFDKLTFYTEYHYIGPNFPVKGKDKQGYELAAQAKFPNFSLSANLNYDHNNLAQDPDQAIIVKRMFQLTTGVNLTHIPPLRGKLEWSREESVKVPPGVDPTDKWMVLTSLDLYESIGSVSYLFHGRWKKEVDKIAGTELDLTSYRSLVTWRMKRAWIWSTVVGGSEWDVKAKEGTSWFGGSAGLGYRLARRLWGWVSLGLGRRGSILSFGLDYRLPGDTNLALMVRRRYTDVSGVSWSGRLWFRKWIEFKLPIPWIKVRGRIKGRIFNDKNGNGKLDSGERGIPEVVLWADNIQAISDSNGKFAFPAMEPGDYKIRLANVPPDYVAGMAFPKRVSLTAGKIAKLEIPLSEPGMISGFVFDDQNKNGIRDKGEAGVAGVGVAILRENFPSRARYTPQNGHFSFARVVAGEYKVILDKRTLPSAFHLTTPVKYAVTLPPGEERTVNFGIYKEVDMKRMPPTAEFTWKPEEPTTKDEVQFTDWSMVIEGKIISWEWDFGDGTTSTGKNPIHQYSKPGTYKVTLTITDDAGLTDGVTYQIEVSAPE